MRDRDTHAGLRVVMTSVRWAGRVGTVARPLWVDAGGCAPRQAWMVDLPSVGRAQHRMVRSYASSFEPAAAPAREVPPC